MGPIRSTSYDRAGAPHLDPDRLGAVR